MEALRARIAELETAVRTAADILYRSFQKSKTEIAQANGEARKILRTVVPLPPKAPAPPSST